MTSAVQRRPGAGVRPGALLFLQATAFLSAAGTGLVVPVTPFLAARLDGDPVHVASAVGLLSASYSLCAFLAAPALGALSDVVGRRPVLLLSLVGSAAGYALFGFADALSLLFLGRAIDGLTAGNVGTVFAYLGDTTPAEQRARYFGRVGAMFGAGLIAGPALGGVALKLGLKAPFFLAALLTALNAAGSYLFLAESLDPATRLRAVDGRAGAGAGRPPGAPGAGLCDRAARRHPAVRAGRHGRAVLGCGGRGGARRRAPPRERRGGARRRRRGVTGRARAAKKKWRPGLDPHAT
ncbi:MULTISPECIES: MFS transporter [Sorangium]|uniref:MFS transporter n=1 Tax=Sorangium TaxID=39643 RepID=UPI003D9C2EDF